MSWQAMEAVQDCKEIGDHTAYCIMYAIARSADKCGVVGADGRKSSPNMETIADRAHVSKRTLINWLPKLEAMGVLTVDRFGKGRGQWNRYTINLTISETPDSNGESTDDYASYGEPWASPIEESYGESELAVMVKDLAVMVNGLQETVKVMVHYGETQGSPDTRDTKRKDKNIYIHPLPEPIQVIVSALEQVVKTPHGIGKNEKEFEDAAYSLIGWDATPESIAEFRKWWDKYGHYDGMPALTSLLAEYRNFISGAKPNVNGRHADEEPELLPGQNEFGY